MDSKITVLTPTYNRANQLKNLYSSLIMQKNLNFQWIIVDDGSTDDTRIVVQEFQKNASFPIKYIYQSNKGKHCALNKGISHINTEYTFIVDSDDILTHNAIETFYHDEKKINGRDDICGIGYLRGYSDNDVIGDKYPCDYEIADYITIRVNQGVSGDKAEIWKTYDLKNCPFPEITNEIFFGEGYVWFKLALKKKTLFINKIIYITEYLEGGLSKSGRALRIKCPVGGMMNAEIMMHKPFNLANRFKGTMLYIAYAKFAKKKFKDILNDTKECFLVFLGYFPGFLLFFIWKKKYLTE